MKPSKQEREYRKLLKAEFLAGYIQEDTIKLYYSELNINERINFRNAVINRIKHFYIGGYYRTSIFPYFNYYIIPNWYELERRRNALFSYYYDNKGISF